MDAAKKIWKFLNGKKRRIAIAMFVVAQTIPMVEIEHPGKWVLIFTFGAVLLGGADIFQAVTK